MASNEHPTCWKLIEGAAKGVASDREEFARRYLPSVRDYLRARWRSAPLAADIDDVTQEVFVALLRSGGVLERLDPAQGSGFRGLLFGVTRKTALHAERTRARRLKRVTDEAVEPDRAPADDPTLSRIFDRSYAKAIVQQAREVMEDASRERGVEAVRRVRLLSAIFHDGVAIRDLAQQWDVDAAHLHREYAKARREFRAAMRTVVAGTDGCSDERAEQECARLLQLL